MSHTTMYFLDHEGRIYDAKTYKNSHGTTNLWTLAGEKAGLPFDLLRMATDPDGYGKQFWNLWKSPKLTPAEQVAFLSTMDGAVCEQLTELADTFDSVTETLYDGKGVWHLPAMAEHLRDAAKDEGVAAVGWCQTSLSKSRFEPHYLDDEDDDVIPFCLKDEQFSSRGFFNLAIGEDGRPVDKGSKAEPAPDDREQRIRRLKYLQDTCSQLEEEYEDMFGSSERNFGTENWAGHTVTVLDAQAVEDLFNSGKVVNGLEPWDEFRREDIKAGVTKHSYFWQPSDVEALEEMDGDIGVDLFVRPDGDIVGHLFYID